MRPKPKPGLMKLPNSYKSAVISSYAYTLASLLAGLYVTKHIFKYLNNDEYGVYILIIETIAVLGLCDIGFTGGLMSFLSREKEDKIRINKIITTVLFWQVILSLAAFLLAILISLEPTWIFKDTKIEDSLLKGALVIAAFGLLVSMISNSLSSILYSQRKITSDNVLKLIALSVRTVIVLSLLSHYQSIYFLITVTLVSQLLNFTQTLIRIRRLLPEVKIQKRFYDTKILKEVFSVSGWFAIGSFATILIERFDAVMTGLVISTEAITILVITRKLFEILKSLIYQLNNSYRPFYGKHYSDGDSVVAYQKFEKLSVISVAVATISGSAVVIINQYFIEIWVGPGKYGGVYLCLFLFFNLVLHSWKITYRAYLSSNLIAKELALSGIVEGVMNVFLAYLLATRYGLAGIVASTFMSSILIQGTALFIIFQKYDIEPRDSYIKRNVFLLLSSLFVGLSALFLMLVMDSVIARVTVWLIIVGLYCCLVKRRYFRSVNYETILRGGI